MIAAGLDQGMAADIVCWMRAHTCRDRIHEARCSDGTVMSLDMWSANQVADFLAKEAAASVQVLPATLCWIKCRTTQLKELAIFVGRLTFAANNYKLPGGRVIRDSEAFGQRLFRAKRTPRSQAAAQCTGQPAAAFKVVCPVPAPKQSNDSMWSLGARARSLSVPSASSTARIRMRVAEEAADCKSKEAFETWWRENRALRVTQPSTSACAKDRIAGKDCCEGRRVVF